MKPEDAYQEFRERFVAAWEDNAQTRLMVAHIETTLATTEERMTEKLAEIAGFLREITLVTNDMEELKQRLNSKRKRIETLEAQEAKLDQTIALLESHISNAEAFFNRRIRLVYLDTLLLLALAALLLLHVR